MDRNFNVLDGYIIVCDQCEKQISTDERWHCSECSNYDLCTTCNEISPKVHPHKMIPDKLLPRHFITEIRSQTSSVKVMEMCFTKFSHLDCFGTRIKANTPSGYGEYVWKTYKTMWEEIQIFAQGLRKLGVKVRSFVGISGMNSEKWLISDWSCLYNSNIVVPISLTIPTPQINYILNLTEIETLICDEDRLKEILHDNLFTTAPTLKHVIIIPLSGSSLTILPLHTIKDHIPPTIKVVTWDDVVTLGSFQSWFQWFKSKPIVTKPDDLVSLSFTSGSTGTPKGAELTEYLWLREWACTGSSIDPNVQIPWTPFAHLTGRLIAISAIICGGRIGFRSRETSNLLEDIQQLEPTLLIVIPAFANQLYKQFQELVSQYSVTKSMEEAEKEAYKEMKNCLGTRLQSITCGTAPTSLEVKRFLSKCFGVRIGEGYGTTECGPISANNSVAFGAQVKLVDVPEMGYFTTDNPYPRGEICVHSDRAIRGYFKEDSSHLFVNIDGKNYTRTGDIGQFRERKLEIIDRKKDIFKLQQGLYVTPAHLETVYLQCPSIRFIFIYGEPIKSYVVAAVVPQEIVMTQWKEQKGVDPVKDPEFHKSIMKEFVQVAQKNKLLGHEVPHGLYLDTVEWSPQNGLLTESFKFNRRKLEQHYIKPLQDLYQELEIEDKKRLQMKPQIEKQIRETVESVLRVTNPCEDVDWMTYGMDSLSAMKISSKLQEQFNVEISPVTLLTSSWNISNMSQYLVHPVAPVSVQDVILPYEAKTYIEKLSQLFPENIKQEYQQYHLRDGHNIFLTGATGFIGMILFIQLYTTFPNMKLTCLIRTHTRQSNQNQSTQDQSTHEQSTQDQSIHQQHYIQLLQTNNLWQDQFLATFSSRVEFIVGDLSQPHFGLTEDHFLTLSNNIDGIIHCAAHVNSMMTYSQLKPTNVDGTLTVLQACLSGTKMKPLFYLSSMSLLDCCSGNLDPEGWNAEGFYSPKRSKHAGGYSQTKYVAECLVRHASEVARLPVHIFRLGFVASHADTGTTNTKDWFTRLVGGIVSSGAFATSGTDCAVELIPADFVARTVVQVAQKGMFGMVYPIVTGHPTKMNNVLEWISQMVMIEKVETYSQWIQAVRERLTSNHPFYLLLESYAEKSDYVRTTNFSFPELVGIEKTMEYQGFVLKGPEYTKEMFEKSFQYLSKLKFF